MKRLTVKQTCQILGIGRTKFDTDVKNRPDFPSKIVDGSRHYYADEEVENYIAKQLKERSKEDKCLG